MESIETMRTSPEIVIIEGIIGAGKSTFINYCLKPTLERRGLRVAIIPEPVEKWKKNGILERFYRDPKRWSYTFQTMAFTDQVLECRKMIELKDIDIFIMERSHISNRIFAEILYESGDIDDLEMEYYNEWSALWDKFIPNIPISFIYLKSSIDISMERIYSRKRSGEEHITAEYQLKLIDKHNRLFGEGSKLKSLVISNSEFDVFDQNDQERIVNIILYFVHPKFLLSYIV